MSIFKVELTCKIVNALDPRGSAWTKSSFQYFLLSSLFLQLSEPYLYPSRICYKLSLKDKAMSDDVKIGDIETLTDGSVFYFKDLGIVLLIVHVGSPLSWQCIRGSPKHDNVALQIAYITIKSWRRATQMTSYCSTVSSNLTQCMWDSFI